MARLVIQLGALEDLVSQLKKAATGGPSDAMGKHRMPDGTMMDDNEMDGEEDITPQFEWECPQCGSSFETPTPKEYIRCPLDNAEMKKVSEKK